MSDRIHLIQEIEELLDPYNYSQTECDGMTRICHTILTQHHIEHQSLILRNNNR